MRWGAILSLIYNWKGQPAHDTTQHKTADYFLAGFRMGVGTSVALLVSTLFGFEKLGWAPSGAGLVIGYDTKRSEALAWARFVATLGGAILATICFFISINILFLMAMSLVFTVLNGLSGQQKLDRCPSFTQPPS